MCVYIETRVLCCPGCHISQTYPDSPFVLFYPIFLLVWSRFISQVRDGVSNALTVIRSLIPLEKRRCQIRIAFMNKLRTHFSPEMFGVYYMWSQVYLLEILHSDHSVHLCVFVDLRTNSDYFLIQKELIGF